MNVLISYGVYMIVSGSLATLSIMLASFLNWQSASSFLNVFSGIGAGMFAIGAIAIICGGYLQMISKEKHQNTPITSFLGSVFGAVISIGLALYSIYLEQSWVVVPEIFDLFIIGFRFFSILGLFASPSCLIKGYLRKIQQGREERSSEANI